MRFKINLADSSFRERRRAGYGLCGGILILLILMGVDFARFRRVDTAVAEVDGRLRLIRAQTSHLRDELRKMGRGGDDASVMENSLRKETHLLNDLIARRRFSWGLFLTELEKRVPDHLSITRIQPEDRTILLEGVAYSLKELSEFSERLEQDHRFGKLFLTREEHLDTDDGVVVAFSMQFEYHPPSLPPPAGGRTEDSP
jgi:hypothetical protein